MKRCRSAPVVPALPVIAVLLLSFCSGGAQPLKAVPSSGQTQSGTTGNEIPQPGDAKQSASITDEIRSLTESGILSSMLNALELINSRNLGGGEFGRVMAGVNITLIKKLYPAWEGELPAADLPPTHRYTKIIREAEKGNYTVPPAAGADYLEYTLPFLALYKETAPERLLPALPDLLKARQLRQDAVLAPLFIGMVHERSGNFDQAQEAFSQAWAVSSECYPAALGMARVMKAQGKAADALQFLSALAEAYPRNAAIKRQFAVGLYDAGQWSRAEPLIAELQQQDRRDGELILMRARIQTVQGQYMQAQASLDQYASFNPVTRRYLLLRAAIQDEGFRNREQALDILRTLLRSFPNDEEASVYAARLMLTSAAAADKTEGREILRRLLESGSPALDVQALALQDAVARESWQEAQGLLNRVLAKRRSPQDLYSAYLVERGMGNAARALAYARELYERDAANDDGITAYISALLDTGRKDEASLMIEKRLAILSGSGSGAAKSRYYYLRSRLQTGEEQVLADLRSSLFEDPRNLNALTALFELYHKRQDKQRAVYYLKQALAIAPNDARLKRHESEYAGMLR